MIATPRLNLAPYRQALKDLKMIQAAGRVVQVVGLTIEAIGLECQIGEVCEIHSRSSAGLLAEVVGFREQRLRALRGRVDRQVRGHVASRMTSHAVGDDPKVATVDGGEHVLVCAADMADFGSPDAEPTRGFFH